MLLPRNYLPIYQASLHLEGHPVQNRVVS